MSPERLLGGPYGGAADVWALGVVLAEAALGRYPFAAAAAAGAGAGAGVNFWDLLDAVVSGPCPADALEAQAAAAAADGRPAEDDGDCFSGSGAAEGLVRAFGYNGESEAESWWGWVSDMYL